ncbi:MAG: hypothetical protein EPO20_30365 [Betaproteobacteria bacterium]|nr:MAG: hypothetical protein EPO20_30365 [Betaproteobacteria bacterium]
MSAPLWILAAAIVLTLAARLLSATVDINLFSFHMFYRNRLVRCYLGASNPKLTELAARPFHLLNTALNLTSSKRLGCQER